MTKFFRNTFYHVLLVLLGSFLFACGGGESKNSSDEGKGSFDTSSAKQSQMDRGPSQGRGAPSSGRGQRAANLNVSKKELKAFIKVSNKVIPLQKEMKKKQQKAVKESGLTMKRYRQIMMAKRKRKDPGMNQKEKDAVKKLQKEQRKQMKKMRKKVKATVKENGALEWKRFNKIAKNLQRNKQLKKRYNKLRREMSGGKRSPLPSKK